MNPFFENTGAGMAIDAAADLVAWLGMLVDVPRLMTAYYTQ